MAAALLFHWNPEGLDADGLLRFERVAAAFPERVEEMSVRSARSERHALRVWSHSASRTEGLWEEPTGSSLALIGNPARADLADLHGDQLLQHLFGECARGGTSRLRTLSPPFAALYYDAAAQRVDVAVDRLAFQHLYIREDQAGGVWVASSSLALASGLPTELDLDGIAEWLVATHFLSDRTCFAGIRKLSWGEEVAIDRVGVRTVRTWEPTSQPTFAGEPVDSYLDGLLESLAACSPREGLATELSGGLDSRLLLAGLVELEAPFFAWTFGQPGSLEVRVVDRLREKASFQHVTVPVDESFAERLPERVEDMHALCDGESNALEYAPLIPVLDALEGRRRVSHSGVGGEIARGFYFRVLGAKGSRKRGIPLEALCQRMMRDSGPLRSALRREVFPKPEEPVRSAVEGFVDSSPASTPEEILDDYYLRVRNQRFCGRSFSTTGYFCSQGLPYFGNEIVDLALSLPDEVKRDGRVVRDALLRLSPALASVPLESGMPVRPPSPRRPGFVLRRGLAYGRRGVAKYGGSRARRLARVPPDTVPWEAAGRSERFGEYLDDLLLSPRARVTELVEGSAVRQTLERVRAGGRVYQLGLLVTLELTLRAVGRAAAGRPVQAARSELAAGSRPLRCV